jgi:VWFA-related protein
VKIFALAILIGSTVPALAQQSSADAIPTLRERANLVIVDVVVTDARHQPVLSLKRDQFTLIEGRTPQVLKGFEEHTAPTGPELAKFPPYPKLPPGIFTNYVPAPSDGTALNVLLLDSLNTPLDAQQYLRQQLLDFVKHEKPGTSVAIFGLSSQLVMLQGFTSSPDILQRAIASQHGKGSILLADPNGGAGFDDSPADLAAQNQPPTPPSVENTGPDLNSVVANLQTFEDVVQNFQTRVRAEYTLDAMNELARYLASIPGRKNLIWFSGAFPINILPTSDGGADPFAAQVNMEAEYRETTDLLARAQVSVYPVDARGLQVAPMYSAQQKGSRYSANPANFNKDLNTFQSGNTAEHQTMSAMAQDTGGEAFFNTNGLSQAVASAIENGSNYYTLAYTPTDKNYNGDFRRIEVKLAAAGYTLSYRHGYYADDPDNPKAIERAKSDIAAPTPAATDAANPEHAVGEGLLQKAMQHGVPGSTQIVYTVRVLPDVQPSITQDTLAKGNVANRTGFLTIKPPYRTYRVDFGVDPSNIVFTRDANGAYHGSVEFVTFIYQPDGQVVNSMSNEVNFTLPPARYAALMRNGGIPMEQLISTPAKGDYFLRTGIHDMTSNHIGSNEIPLSLVKNLPPLPAPPQPAAK